MPDGAFFAYLLVMAGVTYAIRALPLAVFRRRIRSPRLRAFLQYIPYAVLGAMTFPAVFSAAGSRSASLVGTAVAVALGLWGKSLLTVALAACAAAFLTGMLL